MTALRFRDSPQDILLRPRPAPAGTASPIFGAQPFCVPGSCRITDATHAVRNLYHNCLLLYRAGESCQVLTETFCKNMHNMQGQHRTIASAVFGGSFAPISQFEKLEIHTGFLRFPNFILEQNLSPKSLAELCGVAQNLRERAQHVSKKRAGAYDGLRRRSQCLCMISRSAL